MMSRALITAPLILWAGCNVLLAAARAQEGADLAPPSPFGQEYRIQVGDELGIKFFYNPDLNEEVVVRPDGRVSLQLIPEVVAAGKTPTMLGDEIAGLYSVELDQPAITVLVRSFSGQKIFVDGEVEKPGEFTLVGSLTVRQALARAEGAKETARLKEVYVIRRGGNGKPEVLVLNVAYGRDGTDSSQDLSLQPYDVVYVPRSRIANVNKWVDQYLRRNIPVSFGFRIDITN